MNRIISDSGAVAHARALEGRVISVWIKGVEIGRMATFRDGELQVLPERDQDPDVSICGTPIGLLRLLRAGAEPAALRDSSVRI
ncbi:MAG: hypothetical protein ACO3N2_11460, partial [Arenicellales bacterium]